MGTMPERYTSLARTASTSAAPSTPNLEVEINTEAIRRHLDDISRMLTTNNEMRERIREIIRKEIKSARSRIAKDVHNSLNNDPRKAYRSVRSTIYKQVFGGNINILSPRRAGAKYMLTRQRMLDSNPKMHGGNRRKRTARTIALETYFGKDRGFVLRFNNSGTDDRHIKTGKNAKLNGNRGNIAARAIFANPAFRETDAIRAAVSEAFEQEFVELWNEQ